MKKLLIAMAMMSAMAMAQTSGSTDQSTSNSRSTPQASSQSSTSADTSAQSSDTSKDASKDASKDKAALPESDKAAKSDKAAGKEKTVTGCLHKDGDNYWLATRMGKYHVMTSQDLSAHDGHEVKVTGTASKSPMPGSDDKKKINHLEASNVEMVADQCKMGTKSMKMKGDQLEKKDDTKK